MLLITRSYRVTHSKDLDWPESHWAGSDWWVVNGEPLPASESLIGSSANPGGKQCKAIFILVLSLFLSMESSNVFLLVSLSTSCRTFARSDDLMHAGLAAGDRTAGCREKDQVGPPSLAKAPLYRKTSAGEVKPPAGGFRLDGGRLRAAIQHWHGYSLALRAPWSRVVCTQDYVRRLWLEPVLPTAA